jgi:hypothetical protein
MTETLLASRGIGREVLDVLIRQGVVQVTATHLTTRAIIVRRYSLVPLSKKLKHPRNVVDVTAEK